jgi:hypothetical protein
MTNPRWGYVEPIKMVVGALPTVHRADLKVVEHLVGYTQVKLDNGDTIRLHLHVDALTCDAATSSFTPEFRVIPEVVIGPSREFGKLEGVLS